MKQQIIMIGGGNSFENRQGLLNYYKDFDIDLKWENKSWKNWLMWSLEDKYEFIEMARYTKDNADYEVWKIIFEKYLKKLNQEFPIIITHSLGTIFILKYLSENTFPKKIKELHLIAPLVSDNFQSKNDKEKTGTFTFDITQVKSLENLVENIHIWHSIDDEVCDFKNAEYLQSQISKAILHKFENKGHFSQSTFFELFDHLRKSF